MNIQSSRDSSRSVVILAAIDGSAVTDEVLRTVSAWTRISRDAEVHLLHVIEPPSQVDPSGGVCITNMSSLVRDAQQLTAASAEEVRAHFAGRIVTHVAAGGAAREILEAAAEIGADLIVVGPHRRSGPERWLLGSVSEQIMRKAMCAVVIARAKSHVSSRPKIEAPCVACVALQRGTRSEKPRWCPQHDHAWKSARARLEYEYPPTFAVGSMLFRPDR